MDVSEIRKQLAVRPFKPIEIHLDNGEMYLITHPEVIVTKVIVELSRKAAEFLSSSRCFPCFK